jgi:hypothetical protein
VRERASSIPWLHSQSAATALLASVDCTYAEEEGDGRATCHRPAHAPQVSCRLTCCMLRWPTPRTGPHAHVVSCRLCILMDDSVKCTSLDHALGAVPTAIADRRRTSPISNRFVPAPGPRPHTARMRRGLQIAEPRVRWQWPACPATNTHLDKYAVDALHKRITARTQSRVLLHTQVYVPRHTLRACSRAHAPAFHTIRHDSAVERVVGCER